MTHVPHPDARGNAPHIPTPPDSGQQPPGEVRFWMVANMPRLMRAILEAESEHVKPADWGELTQARLQRWGTAAPPAEWYFEVEVEKDALVLFAVLPPNSAGIETTFAVVRDTEGWTSEFLAAVIAGWELMGAPAFALELLKCAVAIMADDERREV